MREAKAFSPGERYALENGMYVLLRGDSRVFSTPVIAVLVDTARGVLVTHGDSASVRHELDEMRRCARGRGTLQHEDDWLLLEGRPGVEPLNDALQNPGDLRALGEAFTGSDAHEAREITRELLARIAQSR